MANGLTYLGPVIWSKLNKFIRSSESLDIFKQRVKRLISQLCWTILLKTAFYVTTNMCLLYTFLNTYIRNYILYFYYLLVNYG